MDSVAFKAVEERTAAVSKFVCAVLEWDVIYQVNCFCVVALDIHKEPSLSVVRVQVVRQSDVQLAILGKLPRPSCTARDRLN
jgi:hypothetical protein